MIHPGILPEPYPGEHFLGLLGRFARRAGYESLRFLLWGGLMRGDYPSRDTGWPPRLRRILSGISSASSGELAETLLLHHSPYGLYDLFFPASAARRVFTHLLHGDHRLYSRPDHDGPQGYVTDLTLPTCVECRESDEAEFGESYWHIEHDGFGIECCWRHGTPLQAYHGSVVYLPLYNPADAGAADFQSSERTYVSTQDAAYAQSAVRLQRLAGAGYIGDQLQQLYAPLIEEIADALQLNRWSRSRRVQRVLDLVLDEWGRTLSYSERLAKKVLRQIVCDIRDGDAKFAMRMIGVCAHEPVSQLAMQQLGVVNIVEAAERKVSENAAMRTIRACGFPRCRRFLPDYRERLERIRGVKRLSTRGHCECGFTCEAKSGQSLIEITDFGELARAMLNELLHDGIEDEGALSRVLSLPPHAIAALRTHSRRLTCLQDVEYRSVSGSA